MTTNAELIAEIIADLREEADELAAWPRQGDDGHAKGRAASKLDSCVTNMRDIADRLAVALERATTPPPGDYVLVPREATDRMLNAASIETRSVGHDAEGRRTTSYLHPDVFVAAYRAMIAAAPPSPPLREVTGADVERAARVYYEEWYEVHDASFVPWADLKPHTRAALLAPMRLALSSLPPDAQAGDGGA